MTRRALDIFCSFLGIVVLLIPMLIIGVIIRMTSPGPALFRQTRVGKDGNEFELLKFRSMRTTSEGPQVTAQGDTRVTAVGRIIRASKIDEIPQLINVFRGDMSLVGPRPEVPGYVALWPAEQRNVILSVRPGITDPITVSLRNESDLLASQSDPEGYYINVLLPQKAEKYAKYVLSRNLKSDISVIFSTLKAIVGN